MKVLNVVRNRWNDFGSNKENVFRTNQKNQTVKKKAD